MVEHTLISSTASSTLLPDLSQDVDDRKKAGQSESQEHNNPRTTPTGWCQQQNNIEVGRCKRTILSPKQRIGSSLNSESHRDQSTQRVHVHVCDVHRENLLRENKSARTRVFSVLITFISLCHHERRCGNSMCA